ncbi:zeaxanthin epoxidase, putative [Medicago truncatula]|uniref:Zeaxanthin epoxidase, putative n=1 Tax=Medicago truncatula TaxID=3880 RepID=G7K6P3_MEDTR|nr:zeaxanthin epoxidase, putative [Medicago truncatula]
MINPVKRGVSKARKACHSLVLSTSHQNPLMKLRTSLVKYRVFLGHKQYFVSSGVGAGKMQWYAFHQEPAGGV